MLKIITPEEQYYYRGRLNFLMGMMRCFQDVPLTLEEQKIATFIIGEAEQHDADFLTEGDIYGGAFLYQRNIRDLPLSFQRLMATSAQENIWSSTTSFFINPHRRTPLRGSSRKSSLGEDERDGFHMFYRELLAKLMEVAQQENIDFLYLTLCPTEFQDTKNKGCWSYISEIKPEDSPDGLFHGILSLSGQKREINQKRSQGESIQNRGVFRKLKEETMTFFSVFLGIIFQRFCRIY